MKKNSDVFSECNTLVRVWNGFLGEAIILWENANVLQANTKFLGGTQKFCEHWNILLQRCYALLRNFCVYLQKHWLKMFFLLSTPYYFYISKSFATQQIFCKGTQMALFHCMVRFGTAHFFLFFIGYIQAHSHILLGNIGCKPRAPNTRDAPGTILLFHIIRNRPVLKASEKSSIWKIYGMQFVPFLQAYAIWPPRPVLLKLWTPVRIRTRREFNPDPPPFRISRALIIFPTLINAC